MWWPGTEIRCEWFAARGGLVNVALRWVCNACSSSPHAGTPAAGAAADGYFSASEMRPAVMSAATYLLPRGPTDQAPSAERCRLNPRTGTESISE